jgi:hypothetical protein
MRQYLRVAVIEVSEESLRLIAGDEVLGQAAGLVDGGMVADVRLDGLLVSAIVAGTPRWPGCGRGPIRRRPTCSRSCRSSRRQSPEAGDWKEASIA